MNELWKSQREREREKLRLLVHTHQRPEAAKVVSLSPRVSVAAGLLREDLFHLHSETAILLAIRFFLFGPCVKKIGALPPLTLTREETPYLLLLLLYCRRERERRRRGVAHKAPAAKKKGIDWINHTICRVENLPMEVDGSGTSSSSDSVPESRSRSNSDCF